MWTRCGPCRSGRLLDGMYILYLDDSGSVQNSNDRYIVLAGAAVFEKQPHWLSSRLDDIAQRLWPDNPVGLEFRGADILGGKSHRRGISGDDRISALNQAPAITANSPHTHLFGAVVHKAAVSPDDPMERAFEQICSRFDRFLGDCIRKIMHRGAQSYWTSQHMKRLCKNSREIFEHKMSGTDGGNFIIWRTCRFLSIPRRPV